MSVLFNRSARVTVWQPKPAAFFSDPNAQNATIVDALRVTFTVVRTGGKEPDTCEIGITNASAESRALFQAKPLCVRLEAGHDDDLRTIFVGDLTFGKSKLEGTDWVTTLTVADGMRAYRNARVAQTFREGTTVLAALQEIARAMQFALPAALVRDPALKQQFPAGVTLQGAAQDQLTRLLDPFGFAWSIQNGRLTVLRTNEVSPNQALVVSADTGLFGAPETGTPSKDQKVPITTISMLLRDEALPGRSLQLTSRNFTAANFKILKSTFTGDTHGGDFKTDCELQPL